MALRELRDASGVLWTIYDVHPSTVRHGTLQIREELAKGWLCFQSDAAKRRLIGIPDQWEQMDDGALCGPQDVGDVVATLTALGATEAERAEARTALLAVMPTADPWVGRVVAKDVPGDTLFPWGAFSGW